MRPLADAERIRVFLRELGSVTTESTRAYLTGGATAVLLGWRPTTIDVDITFVPERDATLRGVARLKDQLGINVELAAPPDFIPAPPGWEERCAFIVQEGRLAVFHFDFYAQALAKIERGHAQDAADVAEMFRRRLVEPRRLRELFARIEPELFRYPALDAAAFRRAVDDAIRASAR